MRNSVVLFFYYLGIILFLNVLAVNKVFICVNQPITQERREALKKKLLDINNVFSGEAPLYEDKYGSIYLDGDCKQLVINPKTLLTKDDPLYQSINDATNEEILSMVRAPLEARKRAVAKAEKEERKICHENDSLCDLIIIVFFVLIFISIYKYKKRKNMQKMWPIKKRKVIVVRKILI